MNVGDGSARAATASRARLRAAATATVLVERGTHVAGLRCMWRGARAWGEGARGGGCACECEFWRQVLRALRSRCESDLSRTHISSKETPPSGKYETIISKIFLKGYCLSERCATYVVFRLVFLRGQTNNFETACPPPYFTKKELKRKTFQLCMYNSVHTREAKAAQPAHVCVGFVVVDFRPPSEERG